MPRPKRIERDQPRKCGLYVRASTTKRAAQVNQDTGERAYEQNLDVQQEQMEKVAAQRGWEVVKLYTDRASGSMESRPGLDALMEDARKGRINTVMVIQFDRFARSARQLILALEEFQVIGVDFVSLRENLDTSTPVGKMMFTLVAGFAEMERGILRERIVAGMAHAAKHGTKSGKPPGRPKRVFDRVAAAELRTQGMGWDKIADQLGVSVSTLWRHVKKGTLGKLVPVANSKAELALTGGPSA